MRTREQVEADIKYAEQTVAIGTRLFSRQVGITQLKKLRAELAAIKQKESGQCGDLDFPAPNHLDQNKRGFDPS